MNKGIAGDAGRNPESIVDANLVSAAFAFGADGIVIDGFTDNKGGGVLGAAFTFRVVPPATPSATISSLIT